MPQITENAAELYHLFNQHQAYQDPVKRVNWLRLSLDEFWLPEQSLSLYGIPEYMALSERERKTLSQYEFLHMLEAGTKFKSLLMERLTRAAQSTQCEIPLLKYYLSEIREEAGISLVFTEIIDRSGLVRTPLLFDDYSWLRRFMRFASVESPLFWLGMLMMEDLPNRLLRNIRHHKDDICPAIMDIALFHAVEKSRHIGLIQRVVTKGIHDLSSTKYYAVRYFLRKMLKQFCDVYFYPQPGMYSLAGLVPGRSWVKLARKNPHRVQFVRQQLSGIKQNLYQLGMYIPDR